MTLAINKNVFITCAVTGSGSSQDKSNEVPRSPKEIADSAIDAAKAGAAIVHCHVRDPETGIPSRRVDLYEEVTKRIRDSEIVTIHSDKSKKIPGSRHYIHAEDVSEAIHFLLTNSINHEVDYGGAKCPKFNIVGSEELNNLELAQIIANSQEKELKYEMVDFHSSRPGHDLRYSLSGEKMKKLGWTPSIKLTERIKQVVDWSLKNENWIEL